MIWMSTIPKWTWHGVLDFGARLSLGLEIYKITIRASASHSEMRGAQKPSFGLTNRQIHNRRLTRWRWAVWDTPGLQKK